MTTFQLVALLLFVVALAAANRQELIKLAKGLLPKRGLDVKPDPVTTKTDRAQELVDDLVMVASLRDRLETDGCKDGAEACTVLLRILVEYRPNKG